jgi:hypothetical protein
VKGYRDNRARASCSRKSRSAFGNRLGVCRGLQASLLAAGGKGGTSAEHAGHAPKAEVAERPALTGHGGEDRSAFGCARAECASATGTAQRWPRPVLRRASGNATVGSNFSRSASGLSRRALRLTNRRAESQGSRGFRGRPVDRPGARNGENRSPEANSLRTC